MRQASYHWIDVVIIILYLGGMMAVGIYFRRQQKNTSEFLLASRSVGWFAIGLSLLSSLNSAVDYIVTPAAYLEWGFIFLIYLPIMLLTLPIILKVFIPFYQRMRIFNCYEYLESRFDISARITASLIFVLWRVSWMGFTIYLPAYALNVVLGLPLMPTIIALGGITTAYTTLGGMRAVVWTDVAQAIIMLTGITATVFIVISEIPGGLPQIWQSGREAGLYRFTAEIAGMNEAQSLWERLSLYFHHPITFWSIAIMTTVSLLTTYGADHVMIQRYLSARSLSDCKRGYLLNFAAQFFYTLLFAILSLALFSYFQFFPLPKGTPYEYYFPYFVAEKLPVGMTGLLIAAIYAAAQSSVSSGISSATSVIYSNVYVRLKLDRFRADEASEEDLQRKHLLFSRLCSLSLGGTITALALIIPQLGTLFAVFNKVVGSFAGVMIPVFLLGMFSQRARSLGVSIGALSGVTAMLLWGFGHKWGLFEEELGYGWTSVVGFVVAIVVGYGLSVLQGPALKPKWMWRDVMRQEVRSQSSLGLTGFMFSETLTEHSRQKDR